MDPKQKRHLSPEPNLYSGSTGITLRPATENDRDFLFHVYANSRGGDQSSNGDDEVGRSDVIKNQFASQQAELAERFPKSDQQIVLVDGVSVGRLWTTRCEKEIRLLDIALLAEHRNQGIGTFLVRRLQTEAAEAVMPLRYSAQRINDEAARFYARLGFRVVEELDTSVLMEWLPAEGA